MASRSHALLVAKTGGKQGREKDELDVMREAFGARRSARKCKRTATQLYDRRHVISSFSSIQNGNYSKISSLRIPGQINFCRMFRKRTARVLIMIPSPDSQHQRCGDRRSVYLNVCRYERTTTSVRRVVRRVPVPMRRHGPAETKRSSRKRRFTWRRRVSERSERKKRSLSSGLDGIGRVLAE